MKNLILFFFCITIFSQIQAQAPVLKNTTNLESTEATSKHQLGWSSNFGLSTNFEKKFNLTHRYALKKDLFLRSSFGVEHTTSGLTDLAQKENFYALGISIGLEKHYQMGKKWTAYFGAEAGYQWNIDDEINKERTFSLSGLAGLKYQLKERLTLFTEASYGFAYDREINDFSGLSTNFKSTTAFTIGVLFSLGKKRIVESPASGF